MTLFQPGCVQSLGIVATQLSMSVIKATAAAALAELMPLCRVEIATDVPVASADPAGVYVLILTVPQNGSPPARFVAAFRSLMKKV